MGHRENGWNSMGQTFVLDLEGRLIKTPEAGVDEGLVWVRMRPVDYNSRPWVFLSDHACLGKK